MERKPVLVGLKNGRVTALSIDTSNEERLSFIENGCDSVILMPENSDVPDFKAEYEIKFVDKATPEGFVLEQKNWISVEIGTPAKFGTRVNIKRKSWDEEDNLVFIESEATYDKDSDFCELSNRSYEYETWFDHSLNKYLEEGEITHWIPITKEAQEQSHD